MHGIDRQRPKRPIMDFWPFPVGLLSRVSLGCVGRLMVECVGAGRVTVGRCGQSVYTVL